MDTKQLRQKILDLAIRGKLVPQDPNDEPASVLLERVKAEKERLIAEGKIKRSKKSASSSDKPHYAVWDLPSGWVWVKLSDIASFGGGKTPSMSDNSYWENGKHLWVTSKDMKSHRISDSRMKISDKALTIMTQYKPGTILIVTRSGILRHSLPIAILEKDATINQDLKAVSFYIQDLHPYIYYAIKAQESFILKEYHKDGTTVDSINFEKFSDILLPIPPKQEQIRIITTIEKLFGLIEEIDNNKKDLQEFVRHTKSIILDMAIYGKLVPQDPADEPAEELLRRINPAAVSTDTSHYNGQNLPNGWIQCKFSDLFNVRSARRVHKADWRSEGIPFYRAREIGKLSDLGTVDNDLYIDNLLYSEFAKSGVPQSGDIMITAVGTLGKTYIVRKGDKFYYKDGSVLCIENRNGIDPRYIEMFISSSHFKEQYIWESQGTTVATLTMDRINSYSFVLPPLNEQKRIVSKVDELFAVIDQIQQSLE